MDLILRKHHLTHITELRVGANIFTQRFSSSCNISNCNGICCKWGVFVDTLERDKILAHSDIIKKHMEPHQENSCDKWFEDWVMNDKDFSSGRAVGTQAMPYGCVFLDSKGKCTLQKACLAEGLNQFELKPFYCVAFPVTIDDSVLIIDDIEIEDRPPCCIISQSGTLSVFDVCKMELEYMLGKDGVEELYELLKSSLDD